MHAANITPVFTINSCKFVARVMLKNCNTITIRILCLLLLAAPVFLYAQNYTDSLKAARRNIDTQYIDELKGQLTGRIYFSQKFTSFNLPGNDGAKDLRFRPNTNLNLGVGATYRAYSLNIAYRFPFLNNDDEKGKTHYLDLQWHGYARRFTIDFLGQIYNGYYLSPKGLGKNDSNEYYQRPDMKLRVFGGAYYHVFNSERFSHRAAFLQSEWQKKSAGSFLLGAEVYGGLIYGDSAFVPSVIQENYQQKGIDKIQLLEIGPGAGYAYTLVIAKHMFVTAAANITADIGIIKEFDGDENETRVAFRPNLIYRTAAGYNSKWWDVSVSFVGNRLALLGESATGSYLINTGNYRINLVRRFTPGPRLKKRLKIFDPNINNNE
jgi:hypothetical protein